MVKFVRLDQHSIAPDGVAVYNYFTMGEKETTEPSAPKPTSDDSGTSESGTSEGGDQSSGGSDNPVEIGLRPEARQFSLEGKSEPEIIIEAKGSSSEAKERDKE